jgi:hypothetical protein
MEPGAELTPLPLLLPLLVPLLPRICGKTTVDDGVIWLRLRPRGSIRYDGSLN